MKNIRLSDSELEPALRVLEAAADSFSFDGDPSDHKLGMVTNIMIKQIRMMLGKDV